MTILRLACAVLILAFAADLPAQGSKAIKKELKTREAAMDQKDPDALVELAVWAKGKGLFRDSKRLLDKAIKINPDHAGANTAMGLVKFGDQWVTKAKAEVLKEKALDAEMKAAGNVKVDGVWVAKDKAKDAKKGIFWHEGEQVTKVEKRAFVAGMVRHPRTGEFIEAKDLQKAEDDQFPDDAGRWLSLKDAEKFHDNIDKPWVVRTKSTTILSTLPLAKIEEFAFEIEAGVTVAKPLFLGKSPGPTLRPVIWIAKDTDEYRQIGQAIGGAGSAYGAFLAENQLEHPQIGTVTPVGTYAHKDWWPYYLRHAGALAFAHGMFAAHEIEAPNWFMRGIGSLAGRYLHPDHRSYFSKKVVERGGVKNVKTFMSAFAINGEMSSEDIEYNISHAGLVVDFAMKGGNDDCLEALQAVSEAVTKKPKSAKKAFKKLEKELISNEDALREYLRGMAQ